MIVYQTNNFKNTPFDGINIDLSTFQTPVRKVKDIIKRQMAKGK